LGNNGIVPITSNLDGVEILARQGEQEKMNPVANFFAFAESTRGGVRVAVNDQTLIMATGDQQSPQIQLRMVGKLNENGSTFDPFSGGLAH